MTRKKKCNSESNSFVTAAEQMCLQPVLEHRQRRGRRNIASQAIPHLCSSNRKDTTSYGVLLDNVVLDTVSIVLGGVTSY